jgi:hypothetical protein
VVPEPSSRYSMKPLVRVIAPGVVTAVNVLVEAGKLSL